MKKALLISLVLVGLSGPTALVFAHEDEENRDRESQYRDRESQYVPIRHDNLNYEINHLNRMLSHVRWEARRYGAGGHLRRELWQAAAEVDHLNRESRHPFVNRNHMRREVARVHGLLHHIEQELHVRAGDFYRWN